MKLLKNVLMPLVLTVVLLVSALYAGERDAGKVPIVIDVRTEAEWNAGHLDGALLIPFERIGAEISRVTTDKKAEIYLYCRSGRRTGIAVDTLKKAGYENLVNLQTVENAARVLKRDVVK